MSRLAAWAATARIAAVCLVAVLAIWGALKPSATPNVQNTQATGYAINTDADLYRAVIDKMRSGEGYYSATSEVHRANGYSLKPFYTVRFPTVATIIAAVGETGAIIGLWCILILAMFAWHSALEVRHERLAALGILAVAGTTLISRDGVYFTEIWAGFLITAALGFRSRWALCVLFTALAVAARELALLFLVVLALWTWPHRVKWTLPLAGTFGAGIALHAAAVAAVVLPGDIRSTGWFAFRGPPGIVGDFVDLSFVQVLPWGLAAPASFAPLLGWYEYGRRDNYFALAWFVGFMLVLMTGARSDNFYWAALMLPAYFIGLAFLPAFGVELFRRHACEEVAASPV